MGDTNLTMSTPTCHVAIPNKSRDKGSSRMGQEATGEKAKMCIEIVKYLDSDNDGTLSREELRHIASHLNPEFADTHTEDIGLDDPRVVSLTGQSNNVLARYMVESYSESWVSSFHASLGLVKDQTALLRKSRNNLNHSGNQVGRFKVVYSGGCRFRTSPNMKDIDLGDDFASGDSCVDVIRFVIGEDGREYAHLSNLKHYLPMKLDNGEPIIERMEDLRAQLLADLDRVQNDIQAAEATMFGVPLTTACNTSGSMIPSPIFAGCAWLMEHGLNDSELFQAAGDKKMVEILVGWFSRNPQYEIPLCQHPLTVCSMMQKFLRELTYADGSPLGKLWGDTPAAAEDFRSKVAALQKSTRGKSKIPLRAPAIRELVMGLDVHNIATLKMLSATMQAILRAPTNTLDANSLRRLLPDIAWAFVIMMENHDEVFGE